MKTPIAIETLYSLYLRHGHVHTDTRKIKNGGLFFALKGDNFDGNQYALEALEKGAAYAVTDDATLPFQENILYCHNVLATLQQLAATHRAQLKIPVIAITGSNGKTTTKELIHAVLSTTYKTYTTQGNLNNHIGIPLTLLSIGADAQMAVIEMGANHQQEIAGYCTYAMPTHGLITNCGKAHLEGFGGVEGVRKGKGELFDYLKNHDAPAFVCSDFSYFDDMTSSRQMNQLIWYGTESGKSAVIAKAVASDPYLIAEVEQGFSEKITIHTQLVGAYNIYNILAAATVGRYFNVPSQAIQDAIEKYVPDNHRSQLITHQGNQIIMDSYNANPTSMMAAIENFASFEGANKILMLGAMAELGENTAEEHEAVVQLIKKYQWDTVVLVGPGFAPFAAGLLYFATAQSAAEWWKIQARTGLKILVKGSRSTGMEKVVFS